MPHRQNSFNIQSCGTEGKIDTPKMHIKWDTDSNLFWRSDKSRRHFGEFY